MIPDSDTSSIPASKSHTMISLPHSIDQLAWSINEKSDAHKPIPILKEWPHERKRQ